MNESLPETPPSGAPSLDDLFALAAAPPFEPIIDHFYFLRHGQTEGNATRIIQFPTIELNETGRSQAEAAARKLKSVHFREIFCSDYRRAHHTGEILAAATGKKLTTMTELRERFFGDWMGTSSANLDWAAHPPGGETLGEFIARTRRGVEQILSVPGDPPMIVAHGGTLRVIVAMLGAKVEEAARNNATPLEFRRDTDGWRLTIL